MVVQQFVESVAEQAAGLVAVQAAGLVAVQAVVQAAEQAVVQAVASVAAQAAEQHFAEFRRPCIQDGALKACGTSDNKQSRADTMRDNRDLQFCTQRCKDNIRTEP